MPRETIPVGLPNVIGPNMSDYEDERATFTWKDARSSLEGLPGGRGLNIAT